MFKICPKCHQAWPSIDSFLADPLVILVGYQMSFRDLQPGFFLFNHHCRGTLALPLFKFADLTDQPIYLSHAGSRDSQLDFCLEDKGYRSCPDKCECNFVNEVTQIISGWKKK